MFFNQWSILIQQPIEYVGGLAHQTIDDIDPVLLSPVVDVVVQCHTSAPPEITRQVTGIEVGGRHAKANAIGRRGRTIAFALAWRPPTSMPVTCRVISG